MKWENINRGIVILARRYGEGTLDTEIPIRNAVFGLWRKALLFLLYE